MSKSKFFSHSPTGKLLTGAISLLALLFATETQAQTLFRAIHLAGPEVTVGSLKFKTAADSNTSSSGKAFTNTTTPLIPSTDAARTSLIRSSVYDHNGLNVKVSAVPNGDYRVYYYVWEDNSSVTYSLSLEGTNIVRNQNTGSAGTWKKVGPFDTKVTDGSLDLQTSAVAVNLSALEIYSLNSSPTVTTPTPTPTQPESTAAVPNTSSRPSVLVMTDIGGDPDDEQSMVRLFLYANDLDIKGLIATRRGIDDNTANGYYVDKARILEMIAAYEKDYQNLRAHDSRFPTASYLRSITKAGSLRGTLGHDTEGSNHIYNVIQTAVARNADPVWVLAWGGTRELAQALRKAKASLSSSAFKAFKSKIRAYFITFQYEPTVGEAIIRENPDLFVVVSGPRSIDGATSMFRGMYQELNTTTFQNQAYMETNITKNHGYLGREYPLDIYLRGSTGLTKGMKEGDSPSLLYILPNGLNNPEDPTQGSWGGRFTKSYDSVSKLTYFNDLNVSDTVSYNGKNVSSRRIPVARFRAEFQREFAARMDWTTRQTANHPPTAALAGASTLSVKSGSAVRLDASPSRDVDGDKLTFKWFIYKEAGSYTGSVNITNATSKTASFTAPSVSRTQTVHAIVEVRDDGTPSLVRYKRVVVNINP